MKVKGIDIDLLFAWIEQKVIDKNMENADDDNLFKGTDD